MKVRILSRSLLQGAIQALFFISWNDRHYALAGHTLAASRIYKSDPPPKSPSSGVGLWSLRSITKNYLSFAGSSSGSLFYFVERPSLCSRWSHTCGQAAFASLTLPLNPPPREWDFGRCAPSQKLSISGRELLRLSFLFRGTTVTILSLVTHLRPSRIYKSDPPPKSPSSGVGLWSLRSITKNYLSFAGSSSGSLFYFVERPSLCSRWSHTCGQAAFASLTLLLLSKKISPLYPVADFYRHYLIFKDSIFIFIYNKKSL